VRDPNQGHLSDGGVVIALGLWVGLQEALLYGDTAWGLGVGVGTGLC
jgi:hypothetical protein